MAQSKSSSGWSKWWVNATYLLGTTGSPKGLILCNGHLSCSQHIRQHKFIAKDFCNRLHKQGPLLNTAQWLQMLCREEDCLQESQGKISNVGKVFGKIIIRPKTSTSFFTCNQCPIWTPFISPTACSNQHYHYHITLMICMSPLHAATLSACTTLRSTCLRHSDSASCRWKRRSKSCKYLNNTAAAPPASMAQMVLDFKLLSLRSLPSIWVLL